MAVQWLAGPGRAVGAVLGVIVELTLWLSVLRVVFAPRRRPARLARWVARLVAGTGTRVARRLPRRLAEPVLDLCAPVSLLLMLACWLVGAAFGFVLLATSAGVTASRPGLPQLRTTGGGAVLALAAAVVLAVLLAAFTAYLVGFIDAHGRRERLVNRLAAQATQIPDADRVLADQLRTGSRDALDRQFAEWAGWVIDLYSSHLAYPGLLYDRSCSELSWTRATVIIMDAAAVVEAVAPVWAPPHTRVLLDSGTSCLQRLAEQAGVAPPVSAVSLQGREECAFADTIELAVRAGLPAERDRRAAWQAFQDIRVGYAPYAMMLGSRLLLSPADAPATRNRDRR